MSQFCTLEEKIPTLVQSELKYMQGSSELEVPFILLAQEPSEVFTLQFSVLISSKQNTRERRKYKFTLIFENVLHELSQNYAYETFCKILTEDNKYVPLFIHQTVRTAQSISITDEFLISDEILFKSRHIFFKICRYKINKNIQIPKNPSEQFHEILEKTENDSDMTIEVEDKSFPVHRCILSSKSDVFKLICTTGMSENLKSVIKIEDFPAEIIEEMLIYIYTGKCQNISKHSRKLFKVAHKYELKELQAMCEEYFLFNLNTENVVHFVDIAKLYDLTDLQIGATKFMKKKEDELVNLKVYQKYLCRHLSKETLIHTLNLILKHDLKLVKSYVLKYIKENKKEIVGNKEVLQFLKANPELMEEIFVYIAQ